MSRFNKPPSDKLLLDAVELRIGGLKWEIVAEKLGRSVESVRKWPLKYPERWEAAAARSEKRLTVDSNAESVVVLRNMLRGEDPKMRWHAAKTLVGLRIDLGKLEVRLFAAHGKTPPDSLTAEQDCEWRFLRELVKKSDAELHAMASHLREHDRFGRALDSSGGDSDSSCAADPTEHDQHDRSAVVLDAATHGEKT